jgi:hypothetical protein
MPTRVLAVAAVGAAVLAAGCGGGGSDQDTSAAVSWADGVCQAVGSWQTSAKTATDTLTGGVPTRSAVTQAAQDVEAATRTLAKDLRALGAPKTEGGAEVKQSLNSLADSLSKSADQIRTAVDGASTGSVLTAATSIGQTLTTTGEQVKTAVQQIDDADAGDELRNAFETADSCGDLQNG